MITSDIRSIDNNYFKNLEDEIYLKSLKQKENYTTPTNYFNDLEQSNERRINKIRQNKNGASFLKDIQTTENEETKLLKLQQKYDKRLIETNDLPKSQIKALINLYKKSKYRGVSSPILIIKLLLICYRFFIHMSLKFAMNYHT